MAARPQVNNIDTEGQGDAGVVPAETAGGDVADGEEDAPGKAQQRCTGNCGGGDDDDIGEELQRSREEGAANTNTGFPAPNGCPSSDDEARGAGTRRGPGDFTLLCVIGRGTYGKVMQVKCKQTGSLYAMKVMRKSYLVKKDQVSYTQQERNILTKVHHPFVIELFCAFQTEVKVYLVMEYAVGGELFYHIRQHQSSLYFYLVLLT